MVVNAALCELPVEASLHYCSFLSVRRELLWVWRQYDLKIGQLELGFWKAVLGGLFEHSGEVDAGGETELRVLCDLAAPALHGAQQGAIFCT